MFTLRDYDYSLPPHLIAQTPADPPESCKLLVIAKETMNITDHIFTDIVDLIDPQTLIIFNDTKVIKARLVFDDLEIFYLHSLDDYRFTALVRPGKKFKVGNTIAMTDDITFKVDKITKDGRQLTCNQPIGEILDQYGQMPLPPYITYDESKADPYQPIFAHKVGSVAAPTASLHFSEQLMQQLKDKGIRSHSTTLHVGLGTFKPVDTPHIKNYNIHAERCQIDKTLFTTLARQKDHGHPILAIGTTVTRTLESLPYVRQYLQKHHMTEMFPKSTQAFRDQLVTPLSSKDIISDLHVDADTPTISFATQLFLYPSQATYIIDELITNFHLPKSSLLMLVASIVGYKEMKHIYQYAIEQQYRFYSFGDAMWIRR